MEEELGETLDFKCVVLMHVAASEAKVKRSGGSYVMQEYEQEVYYIQKSSTEKSPLAKGTRLENSFVPNATIVTLICWGHSFARCARKHGAKKFVKEFEVLA